jgi:Fe-S protein assembly co-chaperone HscB
MTDNYFAVLGLNEALLLDEAVLKKAYFKAQQRYHPDRATTDAERITYLQRSADINCAYHCLKTFDTRLNYLLKLRGIDIESTKDAPATPAALLMETMQWREKWMECDTQAQRVTFSASLDEKIMSHQQRALVAYNEINIPAMVEAALYLRYLSRMKQETERK